MSDTTQPKRLAMWCSPSDEWLASLLIALSICISAAAICAALLGAVAFAMDVSILKATQICWPLLLVLVFASCAYGARIGMSVQRARGAEATQGHGTEANTSA